MRIINIIFISLMLSACASSVNIDYDKNTDFTSLRTYRIDTAPVRVSGDTRINSPFMQQRVESELNTELSKKGFENLKNNAELEIKYYLDIKQEIETQDSAVSIGFGTSSYHSAIGVGFTVPIGEASSIDILVLTIDVFSTKTNKLIWRGSLGYSLYTGATPETYDSLVNELVVEILKNFPPK